jgi:hypothetical protein
MIEAGRVDFTIASADLGQKGNPSMVGGFRSVIETVLEIGYSQADVRKMTATNAANLNQVAQQPVFRRKLQKLTDCSMVYPAEIQAPCDCSRPFIRRC